MASDGEPSVRVLPVTPERWEDMAALFGARGSPGYCWCMAYRRESSADMSNTAKREAMRCLVATGTPVGVLAYDGDEPIGWCSVAPRESYARLARSRTMPRVTMENTWTVLCFFVRRSHRKRGVARALLEGAVEYAHESGSRYIEGYPFDTAGISSTHRGHSSMFQALGFRQDGSRWSLDPGAARRAGPE
ncbi:MAG TPA: GNAT family N-acetyltransferase [Dehalococcoidia bacterium]|nr:GNAT family N-acetyltransferase [Dehalococcoidia bacterium]